LFLIKFLNNFENAIEEIEVILKIEEIK